MNQVILTVMKWLDDPYSVSVEELEDIWFRAARFNSSVTGSGSSFNAADYASKGLILKAEDNVEKYFKETGEDRQKYLDEIKGEESMIEWDGGIPPVGTACDFASTGHHEGFQWCIFHGLMSDGAYIIEYNHRTSPSRTTCAPFDPDLTSFRPVKRREFREGAIYVATNKNTKERQLIMHSDNSFFFFGASLLKIIDSDWIIGSEVPESFWDCEGGSDE